MAYRQPSPAWPLPLSPRVKALNDGLIPLQQPTSLKLTKSADYYEQRCVKYPRRASFHCYAEFVHALLMEADGNVVTFVPQPFRLQIGRTLYTPDVYVRSRTGEVVRELKPEGRSLADGWQEVLVEFFGNHDIGFELISNERVLEQEMLALHWLPIIQILAEAQREVVDTELEESQILYALMENRSLVVGDVLSEPSRCSSYRQELALLRLLHQHRIQADLSQSPWDYDTEISL